MNITIILCTYNRCQSLSKALASVAAQSLPAGIEWDVLVVDNNSQDQTRDIVEGFGRENPGRFHYLYEPQQGLSNARNAGVQNSRGEILAFMDDDVTVKPTWLQNLTAALHDGEWAGAGGRTLPSQPFSPPDWLSAAESFKWGAILGGLFDLGEKPCELKMAPYGANMAFRKSMFEKYGGFRPDLDRSAGSMLSNGDTEFGRRLMIAGERLRYEPLAIVYHPILEKRVQKQYFLTWWFGFGRSEMREVGRRPDIWKIPRRYLTISKTTAVVLIPMLLRWVLSLNRQRRFHYKCQVWRTAGEIFEIHRFWRGGSQQGGKLSHGTKINCSSRP